MRPIAPLVFSVGFIATAYSAAAQIPTRPVGPVVLEYREPFTTISGLRELKDGRVLVTDSRDKTFQLIDLVRGSAVPVGRAGSGPGEWANATGLLAMPGDTTWMSDFANGRFFVVRPDGTPGAPIRFPAEGPIRGGELEGADRNGRILSVRMRTAADRMETSSGEADVILFDRRTNRTDTVAVLAKPKGERAGAAMMPGGMLRLFTNMPFAAQDLALIAPDGRVAVVRAEPYRVEWFGPGKQHIVGTTAQSSSIRIDAAEKEAFTRSQIRPGAIVVSGPTSPPPGQRRNSGTLSSSEVRALIDPSQAWPAVKPPFLERAAHVSPEGSVWVLRTRAWNDSTPVFDVFDGAGRLVERVALPKRTRLVGFGAGVVYLARTDEDDLVWLQRVRYR